MFRTELTITPQERLLPRTARVLTVGSCFADSLGERLRLNKVNALVNPFGTVFQPLALAQLLRAAAGEAQDWQQHVVEARGRWQSYDFHSTVGAESPVELLQNIQETVDRVGDFVRTADVVVLTLGTAWAYRLRETGELVSNLHKLPASLFEKELLTADEVVNGLAEVHALLRRANPNVRIVLTVSPVRHLKDTLPLNAVSKSVLRVACHYLSELLPNVSYFPAYELLTDDLRDYRFYADDMLHPSVAGEEYIWDKFARAYFDADFGRFRKEWAAVRQALGHRPLHIGAPEHRSFLDQTRERLERLTTQGVDVRPELRDVQRQLAALPPPKPVRVVEIEPEDDGEERIDIGGNEGGATTQPISNEPDTAQAEERGRNNNRRNGRRDDRNGRGNRGDRNDRDNRPGRNGQDRRNGQAAPVGEPAEELVVGAAAAEDRQPAELLAAEALPEAAVATAVAALPADLTEALATDEADDEDAADEAEAGDDAAIDEATGYPAKKKKRRSRGGAKRTARKHAARLAAEQAGGEPAADEAAAFEPATLALAEAELLEERALETAGFDTQAPPAAAAEVVTSEADDSAEEAASEMPEAPLVSPEAPGDAPRRRGTGPPPKKSKVITKSGMVKRGQRAGLYRAAAGAPEGAAAPEATAPIISSLIIPEALMERPAADFAALVGPPVAPPVAEEPDLAATVLGLYSSKKPAAAPAATPRRGRPKAASAASVAPAAAVAAPENGPAPAPPVEVATEAPAETAAPAAAEAPAQEAGPAAKATKPAAKKPAAAKKAAAKPAAAKPKATAKALVTKAAATAKTAAKPAAARKGRPPGKKAAPADEPTA